MTCKELKTICDYARDKIEVSLLDNITYISTENMLPNRAGITKATTLPTSSLTQAFQVGDILVSNIRPYFKKIWYAKYNGGCSNDVLVFRAKNEINNKFLYYILSNDKFFDFSMASSKGTKMPRGDKKIIMEYPVPNFDYKTQQKIAHVLSAIDDKIELNNSINNNLEQQAQAIFTNTFQDKIENVDSNKYELLKNLVQNIDNRGKTPPCSTDKTPYPIIDVRALSGNTRIINYNNCTKYVNKDTYDNWFRNGHPEKYDILLSTVGSLAEMKLFMGQIGCIAQNVVGYRCNISPLYLYQYLNFIKKDLLAYDIGSVQPSIKVTHIAKHPIYIPPYDELEKFHSIADAITNQIYANCKENEDLTQLRDTLLPKLMNGEIDVENVEI